MKILDITLFYRIYNIHNSEYKYIEFVIRLPYFLNFHIQKHNIFLYIDKKLYPVIQLRINIFDENDIIDLKAISIDINNISILIIVYAVTISIYANKKNIQYNAKYHLLLK